MHRLASLGEHKIFSDKSQKKRMQLEISKTIRGTPIRKSRLWNCGVVELWNCIKLRTYNLQSCDLTATLCRCNTQ